jgi:hypothetical protein
MPARETPVEGLCEEEGWSALSLGAAAVAKRSIRALIRPFGMLFSGFEGFYKGQFRVQLFVLPEKRRLTIPLSKSHI